MRARWIIVAAALLLPVALLVWWQRQAAPIAPPAIAFPAPAADARQRIEQRLADDHPFRNDVLFLLAATLRDRCQPAQAGLLARMANRASLPVLAAVSAVTQQDPSLDRPIYQYIQHRADATRCGQPLQMPLAGGRSMQVDIEQYARTFPDSYFDPQRSSEPRDFGGLSLQQRASNACNSVVYSVLPLGSTDWRCSSLRANARSRVRRLCEDELRRQHGGTGGELDMAVGQGMQSAVVSAIAALPEDCR